MRSIEHLVRIKFTHNVPGTKIATAAKPWHAILEVASTLYRRSN